MATSTLPKRTKRATGSPASRNGQPAKAHKPKIVWLSPSALTPYERNAMLHPPEHIEQVARSIREFGFTVPVLVDEKRMILAGHARQLAALKEKLPKIPVIIRHGLTEDQKRAYILADNKIARNAEFDWEVLRAELSDLQPVMDATVTGWSDKEIERILADLGTENAFVVKTEQPSETFSEGAQFKSNRPVKITMRCSESALTEELKLALDGLCKQFQLTCNIMTG